jgi:hypothetical protein
MKLKYKLLLFLLPVFLLSGKSIKAQDLRDTIVTKNYEKIICRIIKITDSDIEYKKDKEADAIVYVILKMKVRQIHFGNGKVEIIKRDEMDMNPEAEIIDKRSSIKIHFFSPYYGHLSVTYEKSIKMGMNYETTVGLINNSIMQTSINDQAKLKQGATLTFGPKFILGNSYYMKGMKYVHPLRGSYIKPEIMLTYFTVKNLNYTQYSNITNQSTTYTSDLRVNCASLMLTYGNQWILGNLLTFGYNIGIGYSFISTKYMNSTYGNLISQSPYNNNYYSSGDQASNYTSFLFNQVRSSSNTSGLAFTSNITIGYIFK